MATYDTARAGFVSNEYRIEIATDSTTKSLYSDAREITLETGLSQTDAATLAAKILAAEKSVVRGFEIDIHTIFDFGDFATCPPYVTITDLRTNAVALAGKVIGCSKIDYRNQVTTLVIKG